MPRSLPFACLALSAVCALGLAGCGEVSPGAAATVDGEAIALDDVDAVARALCVFELTSAEQRGEPAEALGTAEYRVQTLNALVNAELAAQLGTDLGVEVPPATYEGRLVDIYPQFEAMPDGDEAVLRDYVRTVVRLEATVRAIGEETGTAGEQALREAEAAADIELDPRFGRFKNGQVVGGSGSLSVPAESGAEGGSGDQPASQTCA